MKIVHIIEHTIGIKMAATIIMSLPFIPKSMFLPIKTKYLSQYGTDKNATKYLYKILKKPSVKTALKLHTIMSLYTEEISKNTAVVSMINQQKELLITFKPKNKKQAYNKIRSLIKCYDFDNAFIEFDKYKTLMKPDEKKLIEHYIQNFKRYLSDIKPYTTKAWENTLSFSHVNSRKKSIIFYIPPPLCKLEISTDTNASMYLETSLFILRFIKSIPKGEFDTIFKLQFGWRYVREPASNHLVVSYHSKGSEENNIRIKESAFSSFFNIDPSGFSGWHSAAKLNANHIKKSLKGTPKSTIDNWHKHIFKEFATNNKSKYIQQNINSESIKFTKDFFFIPLQVTNDVVSELSYIGVINLLKNTIEIAKKHNINIVIKKHPKCDSSKINLILSKCQHDKNIQISNASIHSIIPSCKAVITVNSGVGMEACLHLKRVISSGDSDYNIISPPIKTKNELESAMTSTTQTNKTKIKEFLYWYFEEHLYSLNDTDKMKEYWQRHIQ